MKRQLSEIEALLTDAAVCADYEKAQALTEENDSLNEKLLALYEQWDSLA